MVKPYYERPFAAIRLSLEAVVPALVDCAQRQYDRIARAKEMVETIKRIEENIYHTRQDIAILRNDENNDRSTAIRNDGKLHLSSDPVIRKLGRLEKLMETSSWRFSFGSEIRSKIDAYEIQMQNREMNQADYEHIWKTPAEKLLNMWGSEFQEKEKQDKKKSLA